MLPYKFSIIKLLAKHEYWHFILLVLLINTASIWGSHCQAETQTKAYLTDSVIGADTLTLDTSYMAPLPGEQSDEALNSKVVYSSDDSINFSLTTQKAYLFGNASVAYEGIVLKAAYIELDMNKNIVFATYQKDSLGNTIGKPVFIDDEQEFTTETITYNFETKKGLITQIITQEGEGFIHSDTAKKFENNVLYIKNGAYTTCNQEHPHFAIKSPKIKIIPDDKILTGPAYLSIADIPTPLGVPFGMFPNQKGRASGILIPTYGESAIAGFFLKDGGYYFGINDNMDLALRGDIYSKGSWAARALSSYKKRYKYAGNLSLRYSVFKFGDVELPDFSKEQDFFVSWTHTQDPKAKPNSRFSAKVNAGSSSYNKYNSNNSADYLRNTLQSNISFSKSWTGKPYNLAINLRHSQNTLTKSVDLSLPEVVFSVNRFYPFKSKKKSVGTKWYDKIGVGYRMDAINKINTFDSLLFTSTSLEDLNNGIKHTIPISTSFKIFKYLNLSPSINYTDRWYFQSIEKSWINNTLLTDTVQGFNSASDFSFNTSLKTKIYGMMQFKGKNIKAIRHVATPNISFSYRPDFGEESWGYYKTVQNDVNGNTQTYSIFGDYNTWKGIYGAPPSGKYGVINFGLTNNLEMKVANKKDTITGTKKIILIENLTLSSSYNMAMDSLKWSDIRLNGYTRLINNVLNLKYKATFDPYILITDSNGLTKNINKFEWKEINRLSRIENSDWILSLNLRLKHNMFNKKTTPSKPLTSEQGTAEELEMINQNREDYVDFSIPWSLNINYNLSYLNNYYYTTSKVLDSISDKVIQTLSFSGDINLTEKWKIGFRSGYDFVNKDFTYTSIDIYRDLHCWEMNFNWIPFGFLQSYNFSIKVKSAVLQDLKLTRKREWFDNNFQ